MNVHYLQHQEHIDAANVARWAQTREGVVYTGTQLYRDEPLPALDTVDLLVVPGGAMSVYQEKEYSWLRREKEFVSQALSQRIPVLGLCFGAQLLAEILGGRVYKNTHREFGWHEVRRLKTTAATPFSSCFPERFDAFHWHSDVFDLPHSAIRLAESDVTPNQAFVYDELAYGCQFHPEVSEDCITLLIQYAGYQLEPGPKVQEASAMLPAPHALAASYALLEAMLDYIVATHLS